ncbi:Uncharacterized protein HZ326_28295 [Fusarium oxysporum f. sp. albedinis]|nr:Uncharacterized protein HZ326_28295 [Fusarium oxysporum f. sp. albedinis]
MIAAANKGDSNKTLNAVGYKSNIAGYLWLSIKPQPSIRRCTISLETSGSEVQASVSRGYWRAGGFSTSSNLGSSTWDATCGVLKHNIQHE